MLQTRGLIKDLTQVPREWPFEHYLKLKERLLGQDLKIKSVFNIKDKNPSLSIYYDRRRGHYRFKDFSADKGGDGVQLVQDLFNLSRSQAVLKIIEDFNQSQFKKADQTEIEAFKLRAKFKVKEFVKRSWTTTDRYYWTGFKIGSKLLEKYNVAPLQEYTLFRNTEDGEELLKITGSLIYGFFKSDGSLYKIYQPMLKDNKFIKVESYIQGFEQLTYQKDYLIICSSLKDLMDMQILGYNNVECIAPDSENSLLPDSSVAMFKKKYKAIVTLFDNDEPGKKAMLKYKERFNLPFVILNLSKDLSDSVREHGVETVRETLTPSLREAITSYKP